MIGSFWNSFEVMKISYQWLKEFLPSLKAAPKALADKLTNAGLEVEGIEEHQFQNVVVAEVRTRAKHPNADRLSVCEVFTGKETLQIVCGAPNVTAGKKYPLALIGASLPNGLTVTPAKIRGVESFGMLCSANELKLSEEKTGLMELPDSAKIGAPFAEAMGFNDTLLEVNVTSNRGDCLSHRGIAREVAAILNFKISESKKHLFSNIYKLEDHVKIELKDRAGCRRYCSRVIKNISIAPSPAWLAERLTKLGVRPINNVVDATNYVMLKLGHPLHAFDHRFLRGGVLVIRKAGTSQKFQTLDQQTRELLPEDLVIADREGVVALAGIIGGANSEIRNDTKTVVLEAAAFDPVRIRKTARRLGLQTDSSTRFERGVPVESVKEALDELTSLILELAGGEPSDAADLFPGRKKPVTLKLRSARLTQVLGNPPPAAMVTLLLKSLGLNPKKDAAGWKVTVPYYRFDLSREIDLIEEIVRLTGFGGIKAILPRWEARPLIESAASRHEDQLRSFFAGRGFMETLHTSFAETGEVALKNPLSAEMGALRNSLLPALLKVYQKNRSTNEPSRYFEIRPVTKKGFVEERRVAGIIGGTRSPLNWRGAGDSVDFFDGKGILTDLVAFSKIPETDFTAGGPEIFHPAQSVTLKSGGAVLGFYGRLHPEILARAEIAEEVFYFDIDQARLTELWGRRPIGLKPLSPFPRVVRDLALIADRDLSFEKIVTAIRKRQVSWLAAITPFDLYQGEKIPAGKKSIAFSLVYENAERTLTDEEVNKTHFGLVEDLKRELGVLLR